MERLKATWDAVKQDWRVVAVLSAATTTVVLAAIALIF